MTKILNDFIFDYTKPKNTTSLDDFDTSPKLMSSDETWRVFYRHFKDSETMVPYGKKINFIVDHHKQIWDAFENAT